MSEFIHHVCYLDMFRTSLVHHQERFVEAVFADFDVVISILLDTFSRYFVTAERVE